MSISTAFSLSGLTACGEPPDQYGQERGNRLVIGTSGISCHDLEQFDRRPDIVLDNRQEILGPDAKCLDIRPGAKAQRAAFLRD